MWTLRPCSFGRSHLRIKDAAVVCGRQVAWDFLQKAVGHWKHRVAKALRGASHHLGGAVSNGRALGRHPGAGHGVVGESVSFDHTALFFFWLLAMPGAPSSVLAPSSDALCS